MVGYAEGELVGINIGELIPESERHQVLADIRTFVQDQPVPAPYVLQNVTRDGRVITLEIAWDYKRDNGGRVEGFISVITDITMRRQAEEKLRQSEERIRLITDNIPGLISYVDSSMTYRFANEGYKRWFGLEAEDVIGKSIRELLDAEIYARVIPHIRKALSGEEVTYESNIASSNGSSRDIFNHFVPHLSDDGEVAGYFGLVSDVTEIKNAEKKLNEAEQKLLQSQKLESVGRLAGGVAHDFNNLLTTIIGYSEIISLEQGLSEGTAEGVREIRKAADRAAALTRQLLAFSRKQIVQPQQVDLNKLITNATGMLTRLIPSDIAFDTILSSDIGSITADPGQIDQVIMNLAVNARDAMEDGGTFTIETRNVHIGEKHKGWPPEAGPGMYVGLTASDTGHGMSEEVIERIFDPFYTTKDVGRGTGLGLATVYGIVKQSNGFIRVGSEVDRGTTFEVYFPAAVDQGCEIEASSSSQETHR
jgi:two-component system, cell cycle sensor histidine kinase and response regulator CckA